MNRRQFFGMTAAAVAAAGLSPLVLPHKTLFLPPGGGWGAQYLRIRKVQQYLISNDALPVRYDASWDLPNGEPMQFHILSMDECDDVAIRCLMDRLTHDNGAPNSSQVMLDMPRCVERVSYLKADTTQAWEDHALLTRLGVA